MKDVIITILVIVVAYGIISNHFGFSIKGFFTNKKKNDPVIDYNTLAIRSVAELDDFDRARLKKEYEALCIEVNEEAEKVAERQLKQVEEYNGKCPKCNDTEVTQRIETTSESSGYSGYSDKRIQTVKTTINHCMACGHDWHHRDNITYTTSVYDIAERLIRLLRYHHEAKHETKFDPNRLDNKYDTLEETIDAAIKNIQNKDLFDQTLRYFRGRSLELVKYLIEEVYGEYESHSFMLDKWYTYDKSPLLEWGLKEI